MLWTHILAKYVWRIRSNCKISLCLAVPAHHPHSYKALVLAWLGEFACQILPQTPWRVYQLWFLGPMIRWEGSEWRLPTAKVVPLLPSIPSGSLRRNTYPSWSQKGGDHGVYRECMILRLKTGRVLIPGLRQTHLMWEQEGHLRWRQHCSRNSSVRSRPKLPRRRFNTSNR